MKMNRYLQTFLIVIAILIVSATFTKATTNVSSCENITTPGYYILNQSLNYSYPENYCISISSDNVTLDGNGFSINGYGTIGSDCSAPQQYETTGVFLNNTFNTTIENLVISGTMSSIGLAYFDVITTSEYAGGANSTILNHDVFNNNTWGFVTFGEPFYNLTAINNVFNQTPSCTEASIRLDAGSLAYISNNTINSVFIPNNLGGGNAFQINADNVTITNNYVDIINPDSYMVSLLSNSVFSNNTLKGQYNDQPSIEIGLNSATFSNITISNNQIIASNAPKCIQSTYPVINSTFVNNTCLYPSYFQSDLNNSVFQNNNFSNLTLSLANTYNDSFYNNIFGSASMNYANNSIFINDTFNNGLVSVNGGYSQIEAPIDFTILNSTQNPINSNVTVQDVGYGGVNNLTLNAPSGTGQLNVTTRIANSSGVFNILNNYTASSASLASNSKLRSYLITTEFPFNFTLLTNPQNCTSGIDGNLYYDINSNGDCATINQSLTCQNSVITSENGLGVGITLNASNINVTNCIIDNFSTAFYDNNSNNSLFYNMIENTQNGFEAVNNSNANYYENYFNNVTTAYVFNNSVNDSVYDNNMTNSGTTQYQNQTFNQAVINGFISNNNTHLTITNNIFNNNSGSILNDSNSNNLTVSDNYFNNTNYQMIFNNTVSPTVFNNTFIAPTAIVQADNVNGLKYIQNNFTTTNYIIKTLNFELNVTNSNNTVLDNNTIAMYVTSPLDILTNDLNTTIQNYNSTLSDCGSGGCFNLIGSNNSLIQNNNLYSSPSITTTNSKNNTIINNIFNGNLALNQSQNDTITSNNFYINPMQLSVLNSNNETIANNNFSNGNGYTNPIILNNTNNSRIANNYLITALNLTSSSNNTVYNNTAQNLNDFTGYNNNIATNYFNNSNPVLIQNSNNETLQNNTINDNSSINVTVSGGYYAYATTLTHYNNSAEETFVNTTVGNNFVIHSDNTTLPAGYADGSDNISAGFVNVVGSGNITVMFNSTLASNCTQLVTFLQTILSSYTFTCYDVETVFIAQGINNSYTYTSPMNLTLDAGLSAPYLTSSYLPVTKNTTLSGYSENILNSNNININQENAGVDYVNNTTNTLISNSNLAGLVIDNGLNVTILNDTINNASDSANASFTNYIITNNTYNYTVQWFASLNLSLNGSPKNTSVNATDSFGNNYFQNSTNSSGLTNWFIVNDYEKSNSGLTNFNPYFLSFADPTTISANFTQTQTLTVNLNPNQTNLTASINPNILSTSGYTVTTTLYINNTFNSTIDISCTPSQSWLSVNCSSTIANNTNENFTITINPSFSSSGSYNGGIAVQYQNGTNYYTAYPNVTVQYTAPYYGGGGGYVAPVSKQTNQTNTTTTVSNNSVSNTSTATNNTPTIPVANVTNKTPVYNITNTTLPSTPKNVTIPIQNNSSLIAQPATHATNWFDDYKYYFLSLIIILLIILAYLAYKKRPEKETPISAIISEENQQPKTPLN